MWMNSVVPWPRQQIADRRVEPTINNAVFRIIWRDCSSYFEPVIGVDYGVTSPGRGRTIERFGVGALGQQESLTLRGGITETALRQKPNAITAITTKAPVEG